MTSHLAHDIQNRIEEILTRIEMPHVNARFIRSIRSLGSKTRARARIWSFPSVWQIALSIKPHYVIEVISERFDKLPFEEQTKILIHELLHIPKTFSGALRPHRTRYFRLHKEVDRFYQHYKKQETGSRKQY